MGKKMNKKAPVAEQDAMPQDDFIGLMPMKQERGFEDTRGVEYGKKMGERETPKDFVMNVIPPPGSRGRGQPLFNDPETGRTVRAPRAVRLTQQELIDLYSQGGVVKDGNVYAKVDHGDLDDNYVAFVGFEKDLKRHKQRWPYLDQIIKGIPSGSAPGASGKNPNVDPDLQLDTFGYD